MPFLQTFEPRSDQIGIIAFVNGINWIFPITQWDHCSQIFVESYHKFSLSNIFCDTEYVHVAFGMLSIKVSSRWNLLEGKELMLSSKIVTKYLSNHLTIRYIKRPWRWFKFRGGGGFLVGLRPRLDMWINWKFISSSPH